MYNYLNFASKQLSLKLTETKQQQITLVWVLQSAVLTGE